MPTVQHTVFSVPSGWPKSGESPQTHLLARTDTPFSGKDWFFPTAPFFHAPVRHFTTRSCKFKSCNSRTCKRFLAFHHQLLLRSLYEAEVCQVPMYVTKHTCNRTHTTKKILYYTYGNRAPEQRVM